ncbi:MAG TPA: hypothetical protein VE990_07745 [Acidimicrobiales bacterium]|nr:hypothetical protein [Acidimicrobiales bacterium]
MRRAALVLAGLAGAGLSAWQLAPAQGAPSRGICTAAAGAPCSFTSVAVIGGTNEEGVISSLQVGTFTVAVVTAGQPRNRHGEALGYQGQICSVSIANGGPPKGKPRTDAEGQPISWTGTGAGVVSGLFIQGCTYSVTVNKGGIGTVTVGQTN